MKKSFGVISENNTTVVPVLFQYASGQIFGWKIGGDDFESKKIESYYSKYLDVQ